MHYVLTAMMAALLMILTAGATTVPVQAQEGCPDVITAVFGTTAPKACRVAKCESEWRTWVISPSGHDVGLFQINRIHGIHASTNELVNTTFAYQLSKQGTDWSPWSYPCNVA